MKMKNKHLVALLTNNDDDIYCFRKELIEEILNPTIKFKQTTKNDNCTFCSFKNICKRYPKKYNS